MADGRVEIDIELNDDGVQSDAQKIGKGIGESVSSGVQSGTDKAGSAFGNLKTKATTVFKGIAAAAVGVKLGSIAKDAINVGMAFEKSMSTVQALSGATGDDFDALSAKAKELGQNTQFSASQAADALGYMALAGWDTQQMLGGIDGVLNLAAAGQMDLAQASDLVTDYLSAFNMEAAEAGRMADVMAYAQANANTNVEQLGGALRNCAANANAAGLDIETTSAAISMMANQGLKGERAGTALNAVMRDMTAQMKDGAIAIGETSVAVMDEAGNYRDFVDIMRDVQNATNGMGDAERAAALQSTFTADSIKGLNLLLNAGADSLDTFRDELYGSEGAAEDLAKTMNDNLQGDLLALNSAVESVQVSFTELMIPALRKGVQGLTGVAKAGANVMNFLQGIRPLAYAVGTVLGGYATYATTFRMLGMETKSFGAILRMVPAPLKVAAGLMTALYLASKVTGENVGSAFQNATKKVTQFSTSLQGAVEGMTDRLSTVADGSFMENLANGIGGRFGEIVNAIRENGPALLEAFKGLFSVLVKSAPTILTYISGALNTIRVQIIEALTNMFSGESGQGIVQGIVSMFQGAISNMTTLIPMLANLAVTIVQALANGFVKNAQTLVQGFASMFQSLVGAIATILPIVLDVVVQLMQAIVEMLPTVLPVLIDGIVQLITALVAAVPTFIAAIVPMLPVLVEGICQALITLVPVLIEAFVELFMAFIDALPTIIEMVTTALPQLITAIITVLIENIPTLLAAAVQLFTAILSAIVQMTPQILTAVAALLLSIITNLAEFVVEMGAKALEAGQAFFDEITQKVGEIPGKMLEIGANIVEGIKSGISNAWGAFTGWLGGLAGGLVNTVKGALGIHSPSTVFRDQVGKNSALGIMEGFKMMQGRMNNAVQDFTTGFLNSASSAVNNYGTAFGEFVNFTDKQCEELIDVYEKVEGAETKLDKKHVQMWGNLMKTLGKKGEEAKKWLKSFRKNIEEVNEAVTGNIGLAWAMDSLGVTCDDLVISLTESGNSIKDITSQIDRAVSTVANGFESMKVSSETSLEEWGKNLRGNAAKAKWFAANLDLVFDRIPDSVDSSMLKKAMMEGGYNQWGKILEEMTQLPPDFLASYVKDYNNAVTAASSTTLKSYMSNNPVDGIVKSSLDTLSGAKTDYQKAGTEMGKGLNAGLKSQEKEIISTVKSMAQNSVKAFKDELGIHSPSKVFMELGIMSARGIPVGWEKENPLGQIEQSLKAGVNALNFKTAGNTTTNNNHSQVVNFNQPVRSPAQIAREMRMMQTYGLAGAR